MGLGRQGAFVRVFTRTHYHHVPNLLCLLVKRPTILAAVGTYETALLVSSQVNDRLKALAVLRASSLVACPF